MFEWEYLYESARSFVLLPHVKKKSFVFCLLAFVKNRSFLLLAWKVRSFVRSLAWNFNQIFDRISRFCKNLYEKVPFKTFFVLIWKFRTPDRHRDYGKPRGLDRRKSSPINEASLQEVEASVDVLTTFRFEFCKIVPNWYCSENS